MEGVSTPLVEVRFGGDSRLFEVRRLLCSSSPVVLRNFGDAEDSGESTQLQQARLAMLAVRTMALPFGMSGMPSS